MILTGLVFYGSVWVYELSNYVSLTLEGENSFLSVQGILPVGVIAVSSTSSVLSFTKPVQVVICVSVVVSLLWEVRNRQLPLTKMALFTSISLYVASFQWELLSQMNYVTEAVHQGAFFLMTVLLGALITAVLRKPMRFGFGQSDIVHCYD